MADEAELSAQPIPGLLPERPHQSIGIGTSRRVALSVGDEKESGVLSRGVLRFQRPRGFGTAKHSTSSGCVGSTAIVVKGNRRRAVAARREFLAQHCPPPEIEFQHSGQNDDNRSIGANAAIDHVRDVQLARVFRRACREAGEFTHASTPRARAAKFWRCTAWA